MVKQRILMLVGLALLWLVVANATCGTNRKQGDLVDSYKLARFSLEECRDMGAGSFDPVTLEKGEGLSEQVEEMLAEGSWARADRAITELEQIVALLLDQMKNWDPDADGLSNYAEFMMYGTSWSDSDSDGDGYLDGSEILRYETDPLDHCGVPVDVDAETEVQRRCPALENLGLGDR